MIMSQDPKATKPTRWGRWWKVEFIQAAGQLATEVFEFACQAESRLDQLKADGIRCRIRRCRFDVVIVDHNSKLMIVVNRRLTQQKAIRWASNWTQLNGESGVMLLPAGSKAPTGYELANLDDFEVLA
jgi:hypothetical protein